MTRPITIGGLLTADQAQLRDVVDQAGQLLATVILLRIAVRRLSGGRELTESRLGHLAADLQEAVEDGRAAMRSWQRE